MAPLQKGKKPHEEDYLVIQVPRYLVIRVPRYSLDMTCLVSNLQAAAEDQGGE